MLTFELVFCFEFDIDSSTEPSSDLPHYLVLLLVGRPQVPVWVQRQQLWQLVDRLGRRLRHQILLTMNRCPSASFPYST